MSLSVSKNSIRATGDDANSFFLAFCGDEQLVEMDSNHTGSEKFQRRVKEALEARGFVMEGAGI